MSDHLDLPLVTTGGGYDRASDHRRDEDWLAARWADPRTRVLVVADGRLLLVDGHPQWVPADQAPDGERVLLGGGPGGWRWAVLLAEVPAGEDEAWRGLRDALPALARGDREDVALVFHAVGIAQWRRVTTFCPRDGTRLDPSSAGHELRCQTCGHAQFPRSDPAVIMLIADGEPGSPQERCLLGRSPVWAPGRYSTLAGFVEPGETLEDAVRREVAEETAVVVGEVSYLGSQPWPMPASLMLGFHGRATGTEIRVDGREIEDARWWTREGLRDAIGTGELMLPGGLSISHALIESWYGGPLPGRW